MIRRWLTRVVLSSTTAVALLAAGTSAMADGPEKAGLELDAGESAHTQMRLGMSDVNGLTGQRGTASFDVHLTMWDAAGEPPGDLCGDGGTTVPGVGRAEPIIGLPSAGGDIDHWSDEPVTPGGVNAVPLTLGALAMGVSLAVVREFRRAGTRR